MSSQVNKSSQRFVPKKAGTRNVARTKQRQLSLTRGPTNTPPGSQASEDMSRLLGSSLSSAQLLRQSQMTETIEEDPSPSPSVGVGLETPPATQISPHAIEGGSSQRSPWATRMRSSIPLPLTSDILSSILKTSTTPNEPPTSDPQSSTPSTKPAPVLARKISSIPSKLPFVPLSRPRKKSMSNSFTTPNTPTPSSSNITTPPTTAVAKPVVATKSDTIENTASDTLATPVPASTKAHIFPTSVTTPSIRLTPAIRRSSFVTTPTFQKLKRPAKAAAKNVEPSTSIATDNSLSNSEAIEASDPQQSKPSEPIEAPESKAPIESSEDIQPIEASSPIGSTEDAAKDAATTSEETPINISAPDIAIESPKSPKASPAVKDTSSIATDEVSDKQNSPPSNPNEDTSTVSVPDAPLTISSDEEDTPPKPVAKKKASKSTKVSRKPPARVGRPRKTATSVKPTTRRTRQSTRRNIVEADSDEDDEVVLLDSGTQGINISDSEAEETNAEEPKTAEVQKKATPMGISFRPLASSTSNYSLTRPTSSVRGGSPEPIETRSAYTDDVVTDTLYDKPSHRARILPKLSHRLPMDGSEVESDEDENYSSDEESVIDEIEQSVMVKEEEIYEEARAKRKRKTTRKTATKPRQSRQRAPKAAPRKKRVKTKIEPEYWSDGEVKKQPTNQILKSLGKLELQRYQSKPTLENPLKLVIPETLTREEDGKIIIQPEDLPKHGRGFRPFVIENSEMLVVNPEKFTIADLCGELPIGVEDEKFVKYEEEYRRRRKRREEIYKAKKKARAEGKSIEYISQLGTVQQEEQKREMEEGQKNFNDQYGKMTTTISAPQMQIVGGEIQVNTESTFIDRHRQAAEELGDTRVVEEETSFSKILNNASYSKHTIAERWDNAETEKFYIAISTWGTDFTMLAHLFPGRSRRQLRNKFKLEERRNRVKLDLALERRLAPNVEDFSNISGKQLVSVKEVNELIREIDEDYQQRMVVESANREMARAADAENAMREDATTFGGLSTQGYTNGQRKTKSQIRRELQRNEIVLGSIDD